MSKIFERVMKDLKKYWIPFTFIGLYIILYNLILGGTCPIRLVFGIPCPGCGVTRALVLLVKGDFVGAFKMHPFVYVVILLAGLYAVNAYILGKSCKWLEKPVMAVGILAISFYIYRMMTLFPDTEPMVSYFDHSFIGKIQEIFKKLLH